MSTAGREGRKTKTRRVVKMTKEAIADANWGQSCFTPPGSISFRAKHADGHYGESFIKMPYQVGDILWVREEHYAFGLWQPNGYTETGRQKWKFVTKFHRPPVSRAYCFEHPGSTLPNKAREMGWYKRLGRFMPKSYARTWLEVTDIRVERLQDISEEDAMAEGVEYIVSDILRGYRDYYPKPPSVIEAILDTPKESFFSLWRKINGDESFQTNPWVWVISFKVLSTTGKPTTL